jgi:hypothetical protein
MPPVPRRLHARAVVRGLVVAIVTACLVAFGVGIACPDLTDTSSTHTLGTEVAVALLVWAPGLLLGFCAARRTLRAATRAADPEPRCAQCGYRLRGLDRPRCPECGTPFGKQRSTE